MCHIKKRGQSVYMLIGAVVLIVVIVLAYMNGSQYKAENEEGKEGSIEQSIVPKLNTYIKGCIAQSSIDVIKGIGPSGGTFDPDPYAWMGAMKIAYSCYKEESHRSCVNSMLTRQDIEDELAGRIEQNLDSCISLESFRNGGLEITEGRRDVRVILGKTALVIELMYPMQLKRGDDVEKVEKFQSTIKLPLGILYDISNYITNTESQEMEFDVDEWYQKHPNLFVTIGREIVGEDIQYQLVKEDYIFNFALQKIELQQGRYGCCYNSYDMACFKNVKEESCDEMGGQYDHDPNCLCPTEGRLSCVVSLPDSGCTQGYAEVLKVNEFENSHASLPGAGGFRQSLCCNIVAFYLTQQPDTIGTDCAAGAVFAKLSSAESAHADDPGDADSHFVQKACISAQKNRITCVGRDGICLGEEEPVLSMIDGANSHVGHPYSYDHKVCCKAEEII